MNDTSQMMEFIKTVDGWLSVHEGIFLYKVAEKTKKGSIVEIGSWKGKSTICLAMGSKNGYKQKVIAIDPHEGEFTGGKSSSTYQKFLDNLRKANVLGYVKPIVSTSENAAKKWKGNIGLLFIDGLHDYKHTYQDFSLWSPFVQKNGIIAFHDGFCGHVGPKKVIVEEIFSNSLYSGFGVIGSIIYCKKITAKTFIEKLDRLRNVILIRLALWLNTYSFPGKFFLIHRMIKLFLMNRYTYEALQGK